MVEGVALEKRCAVFPYREFESPPLRQKRGGQALALAVSLLKKFEQSNSGHTCARANLLPFSVVKLLFHHLCRGFYLKSKRPCSRGETGAYE